MPHSTFTLALCFHFGLIQPSTFSFFMCECGHELDAFNMHLLHYLFGDQWIVTHDAFQDVMYVLAPKSGNFVWREWWYSLTLKISLWADLYMTWKDQVFVTNVVVTDPMWEMASSVISRPTIAVVKLSAIIKIRKYKRFHEGHHFISMAMDADLNMIWIVSSRSVCHQKGRVNTTPWLLSWIHSVRMWMTPLMSSRQYHSSPIWSAQLVSFQLYWFPKRGTHQLILSPLR